MIQFYDTNLNFFSLFISLIRSRNSDTTLLFQDDFVKWINQNADFRNSKSRNRSNDFWFWFLKVFSMKSIDIIRCVNKIESWLSEKIDVSLISIIYINCFILKIVFDDSATIYDVKQFVFLVWFFELQVNYHDERFRRCYLFEKKIVKRQMKFSEVKNKNES